MDRKRAKMQLLFRVNSEMVETRSQWGGGLLGPNIVFVQ